MNDNLNQNNDNNAQETNTNTLRTSSAYTEQDQAKKSPFSNYYEEDERKDSPITRAKIFNLIISIVHLFVVNPVVSSYIRIFLIDDQKNSSLFTILYLFLSILWILDALWLILVSNRKLKVLFFVILFSLIGYLGYQYYNGNNIIFNRLEELNKQTLKNYFISEAKAVITLSKKQITIDRTSKDNEKITCFISDNKKVRIEDKSKKCRHIKAVSNKDDNIYYAVIIKEDGDILEYTMFNDKYYMNVDKEKNGNIELELFNDNNIIKEGIFINNNLEISYDNDNYKLEFDLRY